MTSRRWCFTLNNYTPEEEAALQQLECRYMVYGREVASTGTPHLQGFVVFPSNKRDAAVRRLLPRAHVEAARGTTEQAVTYCKKDGNFWEGGNVPQERSAAGKRERDTWNDAYDSAKRGAFDEIPGYVAMRCYRTMREVARDHMVPPPDLDDVCGLWLWGEAGVGKSRTARERFPDFFNKPINKWWDGYQDEPVILLDDFDPSHRVLAHHLKIWADRYAFVGEIKGYARSMRPQKIVVTSQYSPDTIWSDDPEALAAIRRRFVVEQVVKKAEPLPAVEPGVVFDV